MKHFAAALLLASSASAFSPNAQSSRTSALSSAAKAELETLAADLNPAVKYFDPLHLADKSFWDMGQDATIGFLRQAEVKHGRVAMAAFVGYIVQSSYHWPGAMSLDGSGWPSVDLAPEAQWDALPTAAKFQIIGFVGFLEWYDEIASSMNKHYTEGRKPGEYPTFDFFKENVHEIGFNLYDPFNFHKDMTEEQKERGRVVEINNGRLAMIGIMGFVSADKVAGSVPLLTSVAQPYDGQCMAPF